MQMIFFEELPFRILVLSVNEGFATFSTPGKDHFYR